MRLTDKQAEYIQKATRRWCFKVGATGAGKSFIDSFYIIPQRILERRGQGGLSVIMGVTKGTIERNVLEPMRRYYGETVGTINSQNIARLFGENVYCLGAEKVNQVSKIQGATFKYLYGDEVAKWSEEVFNFAKSRLRSPVSCFDGTLNPESPSHYLYRFIYESEDLDLYCQHYEIDDNPFYPEVQKEELKKEYFGTFYYDRYILGLWRKAEGLVFPMFNKNLHVSKTEPRAYTEYWISNDYGVSHPCVFGLFGLYDGVWYMIKEYYHCGEKEGQKTVEEYYKALCELAGDLPLRRFILDQAPIAASFNVHVRNEGKFPRTKANNEVASGIQEVTTALASGKLKINDCCKNTINEFGLYQWKENSPKDEPLMENDDCMSMLRYFVKTAKIVWS